jgi:hypothetical protein
LYSLKNISIQLKAFIQAIGAMHPTHWMNALSAATTQIGVGAQTE